MMKSIFFIILFILFLNGFSISAEEYVSAEQDVMTEMEFIGQMENRITRDLRAYLGNDRFIINIDARIQRVRGTIPRAEPEYSLSPEQQNKLDAVNNLIAQLERQTLEQQDQSPQSIQLPGLPFGEDAIVEVPDNGDDNPVLKNLKTMRENLMDFESTGNLESDSDETSQDIFSRIENMVITLLIDESISLSQEEFVRTLMESKLKLNYFRGDRLVLVRTPFEAISSELQSEPDINMPLAKDTTEPEPWWHQWWLPWAALSAIGIIVFLLLILIFKKPQTAPIVSQTNLQTPEAPSASQADQEPPVLQDIRSIKQDIITAGLGNPDQASSRVEDMVLGGNYIKTLAAAYQTLGGSLFRGLFPGVSTGQIYEINQFLDQNSLSADDIHSELSSLKHLLLRDHDKQPHHSPSKPFKFLDRLADGQIIYLLQDETPRIKALVLSQVSASRAASLLKHLAPAQQGQIAYEIGQFNEFPVATFRDVADRLARKSLNVPSFENINTDGTTLLIDMLDNLPTADEHQLLARIKTDSPETYYRLRQVYYTFNDLGRTPPDILGEVLRDIDRQKLAAALVNADPQLIKYTLEALPNKVRAAIQDQLQYNDIETDNSVIEQARKSIVHQIREVIKTGKFSMQDLATIE